MEADEFTVPGLPEIVKDMDPTVLRATLEFGIEVGLVEPDCRVQEVIAVVLRSG